jgi:hypothetical protein
VERGLSSICALTLIQQPSESRQLKTQDFLRKTFFSAKKRPRFFVFALFARAMCGAGKGVLGGSLRLQRKISPIFVLFFSAKKRRQCPFFLAALIGMSFPMRRLKVTEICFEPGWRLS